MLRKPHVISSSAQNRRQKVFDKGVWHSKIDKNYTDL